MQIGNCKKIDTLLIVSEIKVANTVIGFKVRITFKCTNKFFVQHSTNADLEPARVAIYLLFYL